MQMGEKTKSVLIISILLCSLFVSLTPSVSSEDTEFNDVSTIYWNDYLVDEREFEDVSSASANSSIVVKTLDTEFSVKTLSSIIPAYDNTTKVLTFSIDNPIEYDVDGWVVDDDRDTYILINKTIIEDIYNNSLENLSIRDYYFRSCDENGSFTTELKEWYSVFIENCTDASIVIQPFSGPVLNEKWFTKGSNKSVRFGERSMFVKQTVDSSGLITFDFSHPSNNNGQDVYFNKKWLARKGITDPYFEWGDRIAWKPIGSHVISSAEGDLFVVTPEHFSTITVSQASSGVTYAYNELSGSQDVTVSLAQTKGVDETGYVSGYDKTYNIACCSYSYYPGAVDDCSRDVYLDVDEFLATVSNVKFNFRLQSFYYEDDDTAILRVRNNYYVEGTWTSDTLIQLSESNGWKTPPSKTIDLNDYDQSVKLSFQARSYIFSGTGSVKYRMYDYYDDDDPSEHAYQTLNLIYSGSEYEVISDSVTRTYGPTSEIDEFDWTGMPELNGDGKAIIGIPASPNVLTICNVTNNVTKAELTETSSIVNLDGSNYYYSPTYNIVWIQATSADQRHWYIVNCSAGGSFNINPPSFLRCGDNFACRGVVLDSDGVPLAGMLATTTIFGYDYLEESFYTKNNTYNFSENDGWSLGNNASIEDDKLQLDQVLWWNSSWDNRSVIWLNATSAIDYNFTLALNISYDSEMQSDFDDLRFTDINATELGYYIENKSDGNWASVIVQFGPISLGNNSVAFVYYNNSAATSESNKSKAYIFWENFETGNADQWDVVDFSGGSSVAAHSVRNDSYSCKLLGTDDIIKYLNLSNYELVDVQFMVDPFSLDSGEYAQCRFYDGSGWHNLYSQQSAAYHFESKSVTTTAWVNADSQLRFILYGAESSEGMYLDNILVKPNITAPYPSYCISPENRPGFLQGYGNISYTYDGTINWFKMNAVDVTTDGTVTYWYATNESGPWYAVTKNTYFSFNSTENIYSLYFCVNITSDTFEEIDDLYVDSIWILINTVDYLVNDQPLLESQWNCTNGNYECDIATTSLIPGVYSWQIEFTDISSGLSFIEGGPLWIDVAVSGGGGGSGPYASAHLYYSFFDLNTGTVLDDDFFKFYISPDTDFNTGDRIKGGVRATYLGQTLYYKIVDYFDNQIYPANTSCASVYIDEAETYIDVGINMRQFRVKNMNESTIYFIIRNDTTDLQVGRWIPPYEEAEYFLLDNIYNLTVQYYNSASAALIQTVYIPDFEINSDTFYWIPGYSLADIVIVVNNVNSSILNQIINIGVNINNDGSTVINQVLNSNILLQNIESNISLQHIDTKTVINNLETNITQQVNSVWFAVNNTNTTMMDQANLIKQTITNVESNITTQISGVLQNVTNVNSTVVNQANLVLQQITNTEGNITNQVNQVWQSINNSNNTNITTQLNFINQTIENIDGNLTTQVNIIKQNISNANSTILLQLNSVIQNITNMNASVDTQLNVVSQDIFNMNNTVHVQLNSVSQDILNFRTNISTQVNSVWASVNNTNSSLNYQLNVITSDITNMNTSINTQINAVNTQITNTESNITTQLNYIEVNITNINVSLGDQLNSVQIQIENVNSSISNQVNAVLTEIINTNMSIINQVNLIWNSINNTNTSINTQVVGVHTTITTMWSNINYSFNAVETNISFYNTTIVNLIDDMNATLLAQLMGVLDNVSQGGESVFEKVLEVLSNISDMNTSINGSALTEILNLTQEVQQTIISNFTYIETRIDAVESIVLIRTDDIINAIGSINLTGYNDMMSLLQGILEQFELPHEWRIPDINYSINDTIPPISSISASSALGGGINVRWTSTDNHPFFGVSYTTIYFRIGNATWKVWTSIATASGSDTFTNETQTLVNGTEYWFKCIGIDHAGNVENESDSNMCNITYVYREMPTSGFGDGDSMVLGVIGNMLFWAVIIMLIVSLVALSVWKKHVRRKIANESIARKRPIYLEDTF